MYVIVGLGEKGGKITLNYNQVRSYQADDKLHEGSRQINARELWAEDKASRKPPRVN